MTHPHPTLPTTQQAPSCPPPPPPNQKNNMEADLANMVVPLAVEEELRARIATHPKYAAESSPAVLRRMLLARHLNVDDAYVLWEAWAVWRDEHKPHLIEEVHVQPQLDVSVVSLTGRDKNGHSCVVLKSRNHVPGHFPLEDMLKLTMWVMETSTTRSAKDGYVTLLWDCSGTGMRNVDAALATGKPGIISILRDFYPVRTHPMGEKNHTSEKNHTMCDLPTHLSLTYLRLSSSTPRPGMLAKPVDCELLLGFSDVLGHLDSLY